ncbi:hypothetical protein ASE73_12470 [Sphingomonas sp. Leaf24]|nr:hypothetical protein ASE50_10520 [Sphingomonas sp. Leaf5]KQM85839.1 hypothetical protein ASE73_12470 [Sphingomonas sp. Leaf24]
MLAVAFHHDPDRSGARRDGRTGHGDPRRIAIDRGNTRSPFARIDAATGRTQTAARSVVLRPASRR